MSKEQMLGRVATIKWNPIKEAKASLGSSQSIECGGAVWENKDLFSEVMDITASPVNAQHTGV